MSGYAESKTIVLTGSSAGIGELACDIDNVYDRAGRATTSITKTGTGTWTLSGTNSYTGPTTIANGTLFLANARSLGDRTDVSISEGAILGLNFKGLIHVRKLSLGGKPQPAGAYSAANAPVFLKGSGVLSVQD
jgi:autotransporter-associated beta strand protein